MNEEEKFQNEANEILSSMKNKLFQDLYNDGFSFNYGDERIDSSKLSELTGFDLCTGHPTPAAIAINYDDEQ